MSDFNRVAILGAGVMGSGIAAHLAGGLQLKGLIGWLAWLFVHIIFLVGFRNRLLVLIQWAWAYLTFDKGARLITRSFQSEHRPPA